jgi:hypothetical protein
MTSFGINISKFPTIQDKKKYEEVQADETALHMNLEIRLLLSLSEFASLSHIRRQEHPNPYFNPGAEL